MNKLLKLKEWLTLADAAKRLAVVFDEAVTEADVLQLGLDGRLKLSVLFACPPAAWRGDISEHGEKVDSVQLPDGTSMQFEIGIRLSTKHVLKVQGDRVALDGVCDLLMIGNEKYHVEQTLRLLLGLPTHRQLSGEGTFLKIDGVRGICALQRDKSEQHPVDIQPMPWHPKGYIPALGLPSDSALVIRTRALNNFENSLSETKVDAESVLKPRERDTFLNIIGVMLELLQTPKPGRTSDAAIIREMIDNYPEKQGIAKRTLEKKFADANKSLKEG